MTYCAARVVVLVVFLTSSVAVAISSVSLLVSGPVSGSSADSSSAITASKMGTIMAVVAVLDIHMERKAVGKMKPRINILGEVPTIRMAFSAILL